MGMAHLPLTRRTQTKSELKEMWAVVQLAGQSYLLSAKGLG